MLAGDFNVIPEDRDTFSRRAMANDALFQPESQAAFRRIVNQGWTDALRALHPDEQKLYTFWDYQAGAWPRDAGFRIDHLLCSPQAADRLRGAEVHKWARGEEKASDHAPVCDRTGLERLLVNPVGVIDLGAGQLGDRHHPLIVLQHPAEFADV